MVGTELRQHGWVLVRLTAAVCILSISALLVVRGRALEGGSRDDSAAAVREALSGGVYMGQAAADTVVVFCSPTCTYCRGFLRSLDSIAAPNRLTIVYRFVLSPEAVIDNAIAKGVICASSQGRGRRFLEAGANARLIRGSSDELVEVAARTDVRAITEFIQCIDAHSTAQRLEQDRRLATAIGIRVTPTSIVDEGVVQGVVSTDSVLALLALKRSR